jgi:hypothetical protein
VTAGPVGETGTFRYDPDYLGVHRDDVLVIVDITMRLLHLLRHLLKLGDDRRCSVATVALAGE